MSTELLNTQTMQITQFCGPDRGTDNERRCLHVLCKDIMRHVNSSFEWDSIRLDKSGAVELVSVLNGWIKSLET